MVALRDSMADECKDFGASIGEIRRSHMPKMKTPAADQQQQYQQADYASVPLYAMSSNGSPVCINCTTMRPPRACTASVTAFQACAWASLNKPGMRA